jgi:general secretion pathway protein C
VDRLNRYSPLSELAAVFAMLVAAHAVDARTTEPPPEIPRPHRAKPMVDLPPVRLDPEKFARLMRPPDQSDIDRACLYDLAMQARIVPAFRDGVAIGFKLFAIRPGSLYADAGIQNGDVIESINGYDLTSPDKALEMYSLLTHGDRFDIEVERNRATIHLLLSRAEFLDKRAPCLGPPR